MGVVNTIFSTVSGLYNNINPITLSGVNDVIVVKTKNGEMRCSPFQLRFSRLTFITSKNQVHIYVNGKLTDIDMTITSQGDLLFAHEVAKESVDYERVADYLQSNEAFILSILQNVLEATKRLGNDDQLHILKSRKTNLGFRLLSKNFMIHGKDNLYDNLAKQHSKFYYMLNTAENFAYILNNNKSLLAILENLMNSRQHREHDSCTGPSISYSVCMNTKIETSPDATFNSFQIKEIENPENTVVKLVGCNGQIFYFSFTLLSRLYFEILNSKSKAGKLVEFLEKEHNKCLGWNLFKMKKPLKRDVSFSLKLNSDELKSLNLNPGKNDVLFKISGINKHLEGTIYLWEETDKIIVSDVDGTITKSDVRGHIYTLVGKDWTHSGIASLFSKIVKNGYKIIYLTSRPLGQSTLTKKYLKQISQDSYNLPDGPILHNPDGVFNAVYKEVILRKPEDFKIDCLNEIRSLFEPLNPFVAGFGNRVTDVIAYKTMKIPDNRIYTINHLGQIQAEYSKSMVGTYHTINEFIDSIFPSLSTTNLNHSNHGYNEFSWWRVVKKDN